MGISMYSTPFSLHTGTSSAWSMGLEASEIWVSPLQKASKPSLVPAPPTSMRASGFSSRNSSAAAWVIGYTVLDPSTRILPVAASPPSLPPAPPQATRPNDNPNTRHKPTSNLGRAIPLNPLRSLPPDNINCSIQLTGHDDRAKQPGFSCSYVNSTLNMG